MNETGSNLHIGAVSVPAIVGNLGNNRHFLNYPTDSEILALWSAGRDTLDIARALGVPEAYVANNLPKVLERARQDAEWSAA